MPRASKLLALVLLMYCLLAMVGSAQAAGGLTITPATLTLNLPPGSNEQTAEFAVTNSYETSVLVRFAFEPQLNASSASHSMQQLSISQPEAMIAAGTSIRQIVTVRDDNHISPGSQLADLVIMQVAVPHSGVGVQPSIRMPLIVVKEDGAVAGLALSKVSVPKFSLSIPSSLGVTLHNKGNVIAIPRGYATVSGPSGVVRQGALNTSSLAVSPGGDVSLSASMNKLEGMQWPGLYRATIHYGLGGGQTTAAASSVFFYIAWWHIALVGLLGLAFYHLVRHVRRPGRKKYSSTRHPPGRALLMRKGAA